MARRPTEEELKRLQESVDAITPERVKELMNGQTVIRVMDDEIPMRGDVYVDERPHIRPLSASEITRMRVQDELIHFIKAVDWGNLPDKTQTATFQLGETQYVQVDIQLKDIPKGHKLR